MVVYLLISRVDDYDTSATPMGIFSTYDAAEDFAHEKFKNIRFSNDQYNYWIFDDHLVGKDEKPLVVGNFTGLSIRHREQCDIAIIQYEVK
ncbi:hypothetical protein ACX818_001420 [Acinetobacter baumannii]